MSATEEVARRLTPTERLHEVTLAALTRTPSVPAPDIEIGQEGRTGRWYVKSLSVPPLDGEGWQPWLERVGLMAQMATDSLPFTVPATNGGEG